MNQDGLERRQSWATVATPTTTAVATTPVALTNEISAAVSSMCTVALQPGGILKFNSSYSILLDDSVIFEQPCDNETVFGRNCSDTGNSTVVSFGDPFYASVSPQVYALATATVLSYLLVVLIFITPRTFYVGGPGGTTRFLGGGGIVPGVGGSSSVIGVGRRPLLQKIATITVAVSLTIATSDTFSVAKSQYEAGYMDSANLVEKVVGSTEIRVSRVISDTFLWLAQVQTLIRLFPRHKEKVTIKWLGFGLVTCDAVFSVLENFVSQSTRARPRRFQDAIPALSYLFELSISLIYASCVIYYSLSKRRFAFWHPKMRNILLVAILSLTAVLIPVVFFILDISQPNIATWGEYIRWVGAAAASVVVWEWVERIEALERDERKDGILGREIFDGDEMLAITPSDRGDRRGNKGHYFSSTSTNGGRRIWEKSKSNVLNTIHVRSRIPFRKHRNEEEGPKENKPDQVNGATGNVTSGEIQTTRPAQIATPISRSDTNSAASTVYAVRYHNVSSPSPAIPEEPHDTPPSQTEHPDDVNELGDIIKEVSEESTTLATSQANDDTPPQSVLDPEPSITASGTGTTTGSRQKWQAVSNPFKRKRTEPPAEVAAQIAETNARRSPAQRYHNLRDRLNAFATIQRTRMTGRSVGDASPPLAITVIPAQPRLSIVEHSEEARAITTSKRSSQAFESRRELRGGPKPGRGRNSASHSRRGSMPVTFIPAPVRGGRTWSPGEMHDSQESISTNPSLALGRERLREGQLGAASPVQLSARAQPQTANSASPIDPSTPHHLSRTARSHSSVPDSPDQNRREENSNSDSSSNTSPEGRSTNTPTNRPPKNNAQPSPCHPLHPSAHPTRTRGMTVDSLDDRLNSVSPTKKSKSPTIQQQQQHHTHAQPRSTPAPTQSPSSQQRHILATQPGTKIPTTAPRSADTTSLGLSVATVAAAASDSAARSSVPISPNSTPTPAAAMATNTSTDVDGASANSSPPSNLDALGSQPESESASAVMPNSSTAAGSNPIPGYNRSKSRI